MSTLAVVEAILREAAMPLSVREIVERAGDALPTKSKTPDTVVARDLSMDIKKKSEASTFIRTSPGRYAIRTTTEMATQSPTQSPTMTPTATPTEPAPAISASAVPPSPAAIPAPAAASSLADPAVPTPLVGQSLPHDRSGVRAVPGKPSNSEDTPLSA